MATTVLVSYSLYTYHKNLHDDSTPSHSAEDFRPLPRLFVICSNDVDVETGEAYARRWKLNRKKAKKGHNVQKSEATLLDIACSKVETFTDIFQMYVRQKEPSNTAHEFYNSKAFLKRQRTKEISAERYKDKIASKERQFLTSSDKGEKKLPIMMIGDRGTCVGNTIKGFNHYGGKWLQRRHGRYLAACITNEHNFSQVCTYYFEKIIHPKRMVETADGKTKSIDSNGSSQCINPNCVSLKAGRATQSRDMQSALAGISTLITGRPFKELDPKNSQFNTVKTGNEPSSSGETRIRQSAL